MVIKGVCGTKLIIASSHVRNQVWLFVSNNMLYVCKHKQVCVIPNKKREINVPVQYPALFRGLFIITVYAILVYQAIKSLLQKN